MILKTLTLINYRKFANVTIDFPDGITCIVGLNGVGKSTIFESVAWVLYGSVAARTSANQIKRDGADISEPCKVILEFQYDGDAYVVSREMIGKNFTIDAKLIKNSELIATGADIVNKYIQKKFGMDFRSFYTSIFAKQKELNALSNMNASERRPLILKMLGINSIDLIIKDINIDKKTKQIVIDKLSQDLIDKNGKNKIKSLKEELKQIKINKIKVTSLMKKNKEEIIEYKKEIKELNKKYINCKKQYERISKKIENLNENKIIFENKKKLKENLSLIKNKIKNRYKIIQNSNKKIKNYNELNKNIELVNKKIEKIDLLKLQKLKKIEEKKTINKAIIQNKNNIINKRENINKIGNKANCPTCERTLGKQYNILINKYDQEINNNDIQLKKISDIINNEEKNLERITKEKIALEKRKNYLFDQIRIYDNIKEKIKINQEEIKNDEFELNKILKEIELIKDIKFKYNEYEKLKKKNIENYTINQEILKNLEIKKDKFSEIKLNFQRKLGEFNIIKNEINNINEKINHLKTIKKSIANENNKISYLKMLYQIMKSFRSHLILRIRPILSEYAADIFSKLTDGKYQDIELDELYNIIIYDKGTPYKINRFSGGEEDLANLCLRLSISEVITERAGNYFNFIILDEIFGSQDKIHQKNILKALNFLSLKFRQIILITHVDEIKNHVENIITVNELENGVSNIKIE